MMSLCYRENIAPLRSEYCLVMGKPVITAKGIFTLIRSGA